MFQRDKLIINNKYNNNNLFGSECNIPNTHNIENYKVRFLITFSLL